MSNQAIQKVMDQLADVLGLSVADRAVLNTGSDHPYGCKCAACLAWWVAVGPEDLGDGEWSVGPFTKQEFSEAGGEAPEEDEEEDEEENGETFCNCCHEPISPENLQSNDYCWGHEIDCPNLKKQFSVDCECDVNYHKECCPACHPEKAELALLESECEKIKTLLSFDGFPYFQIDIKPIEEKNNSSEEKLYELTIWHTDKAIEELKYHDNAQDSYTILNAWYNGFLACVKFTQFVKNQKKAI